jgi:hypothetical protein
MLLTLSNSYLAGNFEKAVDTCFDLKSGDPDSFVLVCLLL